VISRERWAERQSGSKEIYPGIVRRRGRARPHARRHVAVWCVPARGTRHSDRPWSATRRAPDSLSALKHKFIGPGQTDAEEMVARSAGKRREIHVRLYWSLEMVPYRELLGAAAMTCRRRLAISGISEHRDTCRRLQWDRRRPFQIPYDSKLQSVCSEAKAACSLWANSIRSGYFQIGLWFGWGSCYRATSPPATVALSSPRSVQPQARDPITVRPVPTTSSATRSKKTRSGGAPQSAEPRRANSVAIEAQLAILAVASKPVFASSRIAGVRHP